VEKRFHVRYCEALGLSARNFADAVNCLQHCIARGDYIRNDSRRGPFFTFAPQ